VSSSSRLGTERPVSTKLRATAVEGLVNFIGRLERAPAINLDVLFRSIATVRVVAAGSRAQFAAMNRAIAWHGLRPVIDRVFAFEDTPAAFRHYESARPFGKVVIAHRG
jgi:NADPH:quinone reductase-like Zn-dependent oxidoreductase